MASNSKQYGLILPQKANQGLVRDRPSVFNDSSESEEETGATDWVKKALKRESEKTFQKNQHLLNMQKALEEDPTVYQYDEVYDKIEEKKAELSNVKKQQDKKPRYIQSLLQQAEKRKREQERRNERIIQKEREAEGDKFKDKESFVTSAYRQKLEEFKILEEEERRQDAIEALTDVSKQKDLSGFYRHLYRQTVSGEKENMTVKGEPEEVIEKSGKSELENEGLDRSETEKNIESKSTPSGNKEIYSEEHSDKRNSRHYRKRRSSSVSNSDDDSAKPGTEDNLDADSDFSDSGSSESGSDESIKDKSQRNTKKNEKKDESDKTRSDTIGDGSSQTKGDKDSSVDSQRKRSNEDLNETINKKIKVENTVENDGKPETKALKQEKKEPGPKPNIWIKRTVGEVFENALQRYYQRKAAKLASRG